MFRLYSCQMVYAKQLALGAEPKIQKAEFKPFFFI